MMLQKKVTKYLDMFETKTRDDKTIVVFKDNATEELRDSVEEAHNGAMPDDWVFDIYQSLLQSIEDYGCECSDDLRDVLPEIVDGLVDIYTSDLTNWLNGNINRVHYLTRAQQEFEPKEAGKTLMLAQYLAIEEIAQHVINLLETEI